MPDPTADRDDLIGPAAGQVVSLAEDGSPTLDRPAGQGGFAKRTHGTAARAVLITGYA